MTAASALVTGFEPSPRLAEAAARQALDRAGLEQASGVLLFLSPDFARHAHGAIVAAARAAGCLQVFGLVVPGLLTETGWVLDQPAAAALVLGGGLALAPTGDHGQPGPLLSFSANAALPIEWLGVPARCGLMQHATPLWQAGRLAADNRIDAAVVGARCSLAISSGLRCLGPAQKIQKANGHDLLGLGSLSAQESLVRSLPADIRERSPLPIHLLGAVREGELRPAIPILSANGDGSLTLAERLQPGEEITWALRQPLAAEADMRQSLEQAAAECSNPAFGLMFSCIGRGPLFYGDDDRDLAAFRERFPGVPLLGAYGSSQIAPVGAANHQWQNSVITALFETDHVQSLP